MTKYQIVTDLTADFPNDKAPDNVVVINMPYIVDDIEYGIDKHLPIEDFYNKLRAGLKNTTSQIDYNDAYKKIEELVKKDIPVLYICFSSGMSGTYSTACLVKKNLEKIYKTANINILDSLSGAGGEGFLVMRALKNQANGMSLEDQIKDLNNIKNFQQHLYVVKDLSYIYRSGRIKKKEQIVGKILDIKPILSLDEKGGVKTLVKTIGMRSTIKKIVSLIKDEYDPNQNDFIYLCHGNSYSDLEPLKEKIKSVIKDVVFKIGHVGVMVGSHVGPNSIATFYISKNKRG